MGVYSCTLRGILASFDNSLSKDLDSLSLRRPGGNFAASAAAARRFDSGILGGDAPLREGFFLSSNMQSWHARLLAMYQSFLSKKDTMQNEIKL